MHMCCIFEIQTPFTVPEMTFKGQSRSSAISSFVRLHGLFIRDWKSKQHLFSDKSSLNDLEGRSRLLAVAHFKKSHITLLSISGL